MSYTVFVFSFVGLIAPPIIIERINKLINIKAIFFLDTSFLKIKVRFVGLAKPASRRIRQTRENKPNRTDIYNCYAYGNIAI